MILSPTLRKPLLLAVAVFTAYMVSLPAGFIDYDDGWLIRDNKTLHRTDSGVLTAIWSDLSFDTRSGLGSEYLPVRDTFVGIEGHLVGFVPQLMRLVGLGLYIAAALLLRAYLVRVLPKDGVGEIAAWLFALHPVHAESVAWLAGQKDLLALVFVAAALLIYARNDRWNRVAPLLVLLAALSKSMAVIAPGLLLLHDLLVRRRPRWGVLAISAVAVLASFALHFQVGRTVGMFAPQPGGARIHTAATMGPVWARYLFHSLLPVHLSVERDVPVHTAYELWPWTGYLLLLLLGAAAVWLRAKRHERWGLWALGWFAAALLPVSQVFTPLQNLMADRYLLLAVLGPCVALAVVIRRARLPVQVAVVAAVGILTVQRAYLFTSDILLWENATAATTHSTRAPYQLALAYQKADRPKDAESAFRAAMDRASSRDDNGRAAANNLAEMLTGQGRLPEALTLLRAAVERFPDEPRVLNNLAEITARGGDEAGARRLFEKLVRRFPTYEKGLRNYEKRYGRLPEGR